MSKFDVRIDASGVAKFEALVRAKRGELVAEIAEDARRLAPVETGQLQRSISVDRSAGEVRVSAPHWRFVEYGTEDMRAQPFMRPALFRRRGV